MRELWMDVFGDDRATVDHFILSYYDPALCYTHIKEDRVVAMLHIVPITHNGNRCAYIYAVATAEEYRGRGIASALITSALRDIDRGGYDYAALIPATAETAKFYERFGFEYTTELFDFSEVDTDYDLGTGVREQDVAMIRNCLKFI